MVSTTVFGLKSYVGLGSSGFNPGIARAKAAGYKVEHRPYADGAAGIQDSIENVARKIREGRLDPDVRGWAGDILIAAGKPKSVREQAQAILDAFRELTVYVPDPVGAEYIASGAATMCLRPGLCIRARDCDDGTVLIGSALMSIGIPVQLCKQSFGADAQEHVLLVCASEGGDWLACDPSTDFKVGRRPYAVSEVFVDPMQQIGSVGTSGAEIVTLGAAPGFGRGGGGGHGGGGRGGGGGGHFSGAARATHFHGGGGGGGAWRSRFNHRRFHGGHWWGWYPQSGWILVADASCGQWGAPIDYVPGQNDNLYIEAARQMRESGNQPVSEAYAGELYLFTMENGGLMVRPCADRFGGVVVPYGLGAAPTQVGLGLTSTSDVEQLDQQVQANVTSLQTAMQACTAVSATDREAFAGFVAAWESLHAHWQFFKDTFFKGISPMINPLLPIAGAIQLGSIADDMRGYASRIPGWQEVIKLACPNYQPPPNIVTPTPTPEGPPTESFTDKVKEVAKVVGGTAIALVGAYGVYKIIQVASEASAAKSVASGIFSTGRTKRDSPQALRRYAPYRSGRSE